MAKAKDKDIIEVDILGEEIEKDLPHWLHPARRYSAKHDEKRKLQQMERSNKIMGKGPK